tara:strand:+ start:697 stop:1023 length:327 start_codon:yes stop_codon:yes gene_type:complete
MGFKVNEELLIALFVLGIFLAEYITGRPSGEISALTQYPHQKLPSIFLGWGAGEITQLYHIHHWMWCIVSSFVFALFNQFEIAAFLMGCFVQGLTYPDKFHIRIGGVS